VRLTLNQTRKGPTGRPRSSLDCATRPLLARMRRRSAGLSGLWSSVRARALSWPGGGRIWRGWGLAGAVWRLRQPAGHLDRRVGSGAAWLRGCVAAWLRGPAPTIGPGSAAQHRARVAHPGGAQHVASQVAHHRGAAAVLQEGGVGLGGVGCGGIARAQARGRCSAAAASSAPSAAAAGPTCTSMPLALSSASASAKAPCSAAHASSPGPPPPPPLQLPRCLRGRGVQRCSRRPESAAAAAAACAMARCERPAALHRCGSRRCGRAHSLEHQRRQGLAQVGRHLVAQRAVAIEHPHQRGAGRAKGAELEAGVLVGVLVAGGKACGAVRGARRVLAGWRLAAAAAGNQAQVGAYLCACMRPS
jgi:hypothetical protein